MCGRLLPKARLECVWLLPARARASVCVSLLHGAPGCVGLLTGRAMHNLYLPVGCCCSCMRCLRSRLPLPLSQMCLGIDTVRLRITSFGNTITYP